MNPLKNVELSKSAGHGAHRRLLLVTSYFLLETGRLKFSHYVDHLPTKSNCTKFQPLKVFNR